jgi:hypothetical protein
VKPGTVLKPLYRLTGGWNRHDSREVTLQQGELVLVLHWATRSLLSAEGELFRFPLSWVGSTDFLVVCEPKEDTTT